MMEINKHVKGAHYQEFCMMLPKLKRNKTMWVSMELLNQRQGKKTNLNIWFKNFRERKLGEKLLKPLEKNTGHVQ